MRTLIILSAILSAACNDTERTACEIRADAVCSVSVPCDGGDFETCYADAVRSCQVITLTNDTVSAYQCEEEYSDLTCSQWRHESHPACNAFNWGR